AGNSGSWSDVGHDAVSVSASAGTVTTNADGTWSWSLATEDGPGDSRIVTVTATDADGASTSTTFQLNVTNAPPTLTALTATAAATASVTPLVASGVTLTTGVLAIGGTDGNDRIQIHAQTRGPNHQRVYLVTAVFNIGSGQVTVFVGTFVASDVQQIVISGR